MKNQKAFKDFLIACSSIYNVELPVEVIDVYWTILKPFTDEECQNTFNKIIGECRFMPKPADLLKMLRSQKPNHAVEAWQVVKDAITAHGTYSNPQFEDPKIHGVLNRIGGWVRICQSDQASMPFIEKDFLKHYQEMPDNAEGRQLKGLGHSSPVVKCGYLNKPELKALPGGRN